MATDARYKIKDYLNSYLTAGNLLEDDEVTNATYIIAYGYPTYSITRVFKDKAVDLIFSIDKPTSKPMLDLDQTPYGYHESVPVECYCIDKTGITGVKLLSQAEIELRRVLEEYPTGSQLWLSDSIDITKLIGRTKVYGVRIIVEYERDTTT